MAIFAGADCGRIMVSCNGPNDKLSEGERRVLPPRWGHHATLNCPHREPTLSISTPIKTRQNELRSNLKLQAFASCTLLMMITTTIIHGKETSFLRSLYAERHPSLSRGTFQSTKLYAQHPKQAIHHLTGSLHVQRTDPLC